MEVMDKADLFSMIRSPRCYLIAVAIMSAVVAGGCPNKDDPAERFRRDAKLLFPVPEAGKKPVLTKPVTLSRLRMTAIRLPLGVASRSEAIWKHLDNRRIARDTVARLAINGVRIGVGRQKNWPTLVKVIEALNGQMLNTSIMPVLAGKPVKVLLDRHDQPQTIFTFRLDQTLYGKIYPPGHNRLAIDCNINDFSIGGMTLSILPQIQQFRRKIQYHKQPGGFSMTTAPILHSFYALQCEVPLSDTDFIIIGPGGRSARSTSVGYNFFLQDIRGVKYETLVLIAPQVVRISTNNPAPARSKIGLMGIPKNTSPKK